MLLTLWPFLFQHECHREQSQTHKKLVCPVWCGRTGMNWKADCEPGVTTQHHWPTSLLPLVHEKEQILGCNTCSTISHMCAMFGCPLTFGHAVCCCGEPLSVYNILTYCVDQLQRSGLFYWSVLSRFDVNSLHWLWVVIGFRLLSYRRERVSTF